MFKTQYNFDHNDPKHFETPTGVSETVPDQSYTIQELFEKYRVGLIPDIALHPEYPDGDDPDIDMDMFEPQDLTDVDDEVRYVKSALDLAKAKSSKKETTSKSTISEESEPDNGA